jgi:hypothetical protein
VLSALRLSYSFDKRITLVRAEDIPVFRNKTGSVYDLSPVLTDKQRPIQANNPETEAKFQVEKTT